MGLATRNIFLDTNIYEENNFFHSTNIQSLFNYSKSGTISLFMTDISKLELIDRMNKNLVKLRNDHNELVKNINRTRILNNLQIYNSLSNQPLLNTAEALEQLTRKLHRILLANKIGIISSDNLNCYDVFYKHFNNQIPFSIKKNLEFKDAFILKALETWCIKKKKKIFMVTKDHDFEGYKNSRIILRNDLTKLLEQITEYYDVIKNVRIIPTIQSSLRSNEIQLLELIHQRISDLIVLDVDYEKVSNIVIGFPKMVDYKIVSIRSTYSEINYNIEIEYGFTVFPTVNDINRSIFEDKVTAKRIKGVIDLTCDLEIYFSRPNDIKLKWINSNQKVRISL